MAEPERRDFGGRDQDLDHLAEDGPEDGQRQWGTCLAEGGCGEGSASHQGDVNRGRVAMEDLNEEPANDGRRSQEAAIAPGVTGGSASGVDEVAAELGGEVLSEGLERGRNPAMHRRSSCAMGVGKNTMVHGGPVLLKRCACSSLAGLMPFPLFPPLFRSWRTIPYARVCHEFRWISIAFPLTSHRFRGILNSDIEGMNEKSLSPRLHQAAWVGCDTSPTGLDFMKIVVE